MFRQLTQAMSVATTLSARVIAKAIAMPVDTALWAHETTNRSPPQWHSRNKVVLASPFALLRDFSAGADDVVPTLLFPPLAGHASCIIDKNGQSQVQLCITTGLTNVYSFDWLSATSATKDTTEDDRLDFITRAVDLIAGPGGTVNLAGDCQGGWEATLWAALHPERVNTLIVAGAPIDTSAGNGPAKKLMPILIPRGNMALYKAMVKAFGGIVPGLNNVMGSIATDAATHVAEYLKVYGHVHDREYLDQFSDFYDWYLHPVAHAELAEYPGHVCLDGGLAEEQPGSDLGVGQPAGDQLQDLELALGQLGEALAARGVARRAADVPLDQTLGDRGCEQRFAGRDCSHGFGELAGWRVLEQEPGRACPQRLVHVVVEVEGGEHENLWCLLALDG